MIDKNCTNYWETRAQLAEAVIAENQIGAWKKWRDHKDKPCDCEKCKTKK